MKRRDFLKSVLAMCAVPLAWPHKPAAKIDSALHISQIGSYPPGSFIYIWRGADGKRHCRVELNGDVIDGRMIDTQCGLLLHGPAGGGGRNHG